MPNDRWVFVLKVQDRPGSLSAVASVFSNRGVSLDMILGNSMARSTPETDTIVVSFRSHERRKEELRRTLERMSRVRGVQDYSWDSPELRAFAVARITKEAAEAGADPGLVLEQINESGDHCTVLVSGTPEEVERAVTRWREDGKLVDLVTGVLSL